ncbi:MAG: NTP transferase domain-containing protein [Haloarculaceae archaeon]
MCGGRGTRLDTEREKPLVRVGGEPMVDRVIGALDASSVEGIYAVTSSNAPETADHVSVPCIETAGEGYVSDLDAALSAPRIDRPVLTVVADLTLLDGAVIDRVLDAHEGGSLTVVVPAALTDALGVSADTTFEEDGRTVAPTGLNVVGEGPDRRLCSWDARLAVNVNYDEDLAVARGLV